MKRLSHILFWIMLTMTLIFTLIIHGLEWEPIVANEMNLFAGETIMYLTGLGALYFGWRRIDHKLPSKRKQE